MVCLKRLGIVMQPMEDKLGKFARFNPGAVEKEGVVHMLYRATNSKIQDQANYISSIGYAKLDVEGNVLYDSNEKVIYPTLPEEVMGCEDPRIVAFEGSYYVFYAAFDGSDARVAIARTDDFVIYVKLGVIRHFTWDKDAFIFPERINGKIAYIHRIIPDIQIDYFDSFEEMLSEERWSNYENEVKASTFMTSVFEWEGKKVGGSLPPIKTDRGWIFIYHGVDENMVYRAGGALLDLNDPSIVISRIPYPILEPEEDYELYGDVNNVVFPEGASVYNDELYVYYGAADKYIALAKIGMEELMNEFEKYFIKK